MTPAHTTSLIVAERGSDWAPWADRFRLAAPDVVIVLQHKGESVAQFAVRVRARLQGLDMSARRLVQAVVVGGGRTDHDALSARSLAIRAIASEMARRGGGQVMLDDAGTDRHSMAALASTIQMLVHGTGVSVIHTKSDTRVAA